jgi:hypothetical protein
VRGASIGGAAAASRRGLGKTGAGCRSLTLFLHLQVPGLLGTTQNELGIRKWLEDQGHTLVTTSDKEGENSTFDKELVDAEIIITTP